MNSLPAEILSSIFSQCPTLNLILTCKHWKQIILKECTTCNYCHKIITIYNTTLWINPDDDPVCHGYYGSIEKYNILKEMIKAKPQFLQCINRQSLGLCYQAVKHDDRAIKFVKHMDTILIGAVIKNNPQYLEHSTNYTYKQYLRFVEYNGKCLQYIPNEHHTDELCMVAIKQNPKSLKFIEDQSEKLCIYAIQQSLWKMPYMQFIKNFTEDIYVALYKSNKKSISQFKYEIGF